YDPHDGPCCTVQTFLPDLNSPPHSSWNTSVIEVFVEHFMQLHPRAPQDRVEELFSGHLKYLCTRWQNTTMDPKKVKSRQSLLNRAERQRNLYYRRLQVAHAYAPLRRHIPMLMALGPKGMSSDESDHKKGFAQYGVFKKEWRNPLITAWLRVFDSLYRRLRLNDVDKNSPGSQPHSRFYSVKTSKRRPPVKGLPKNAY
ncbi:uncharacterized protein TRAVEDRAFT_84790, partial [Trametes versicolor FP-101664 SS1]|uniref:uncharacterized protein n=1 Tax=Trametes versicolor (strain FP-101664) TaxID=717944 RepID=UPI000462296E